MVLLLPKRASALVAACGAVLAAIAAVSSVTALTPREPERSRDGLGSVQTPLAERVYKILHLPAMSHPWLPSLAKLINALPQVGLSSGTTSFSSAFARHARETSALVNALNNGVDPIALYREILKYLDLDGQYTLPRGEKWRYGNIVQRMYLYEALFREAGHLISAGHNKAGKKYIRAALLIACQDEIQVGWWFPLHILVPPHLPPNWGHVNPKQLARRERNFRIYFAAIGGEPGWRQLHNLYRIAVHRERSPFTKNYNALLGPGPMEGAKTPRAVNRAETEILGHLRLAIRAVPNIHWSYELLRGVLEVRQTLKREGHDRTSEAIKAVLVSWETRERADTTMPRFEREVLLRWIKEASN